MILKALVANYGTAGLEEETRTWWGKRFEVWRFETQCEHFEAQGERGKQARICCYKHGGE